MCVCECERKKGPIDFKSFENYSTFNIFWFNMASGDQTASITLKFVQKRIYRLVNISNLETRKRQTESNFPNQCQ